MTTTQIAIERALSMFVADLATDGLSITGGISCDLYAGADPLWSATFSGARSPGTIVIGPACANGDSPLRALIKAHGQYRRVLATAEAREVTE